MSWDGRLKCLQLCMFDHYFDRLQVRNNTQINSHLPCHLFQPTHLGTYPKTTTESIENRLWMCLLFMWHSTIEHCARLKKIDNLCLKLILGNLNFLELIQLFSPRILITKSLFYSVSQLVLL